MYFLNASKLSLALAMAVILGSQAHGATPTQALFSTTKTPAGQFVATQLEIFKTISDADLLDLKTAVLQAQRTASVFALAAGSRGLHRLMAPRMAKSFVGRLR